MKKNPIASISVSELKAVLLSVIRRVEQGACFEVTKANRKVAVIFPYGHSQLPSLGFGGGTIRKSTRLPLEPWTYDVANLKPGDE